MFWNQWVQLFFYLTLSLLIYAVFLVIPIPKGIGLEIRYGFGGILLASLLLFLIFNCSGKQKVLGSFVLTLILFALPVSGLWNSGISEPMTVGGLLPWSDASSYYWDAERVLLGERFSFNSSRRPLFAAVLSAVLGLTGHNLQIALAIFAALTAISCFFLIREIQRSYGIFAGVVVLVLLLMFYRRFSGTVMTENLGFPLGALGFAVLWRGARHKRISFSLLGIALLSLALNARAGAFFILPAIAIWGTICFRGKAKFSLRFLMGSIVAILSGFILNSVFLKILGSPDGIVFSNFSHTLYGLVLGGKTWTQILADHPGAQEKDFYALVFEAFRQNPFGIVVGSLKAWIQYFIPNWSGAFGFLTISSSVNLTNRFIVFLIRTALYVFSFLAFLGCYYRRGKPENALMIVLSVGILLSVPFVPPWDADSMRVYAATIPISVTLPVIGMTFLFARMGWNFWLNFSKDSPGDRLLLLFSTSLILFIALAPIATKAISRPVPLPDLICKNGLEPIYLKIDPGASVKLVSDNSLKRTHLPDVRLSDFRTGLTGFSKLYPVAADALVDVDANSTLMQNINLSDKQLIWLVSNDSEALEVGNIVGVCGHRNAKAPILFQVDEIQTSTKN